MANVCFVSQNGYRVAWELILSYRSGAIDSPFGTWVGGLVPTARLRGFKLEIQNFGLTIDGSSRQSPPTQPLVNGKTDAFNVQRSTPTHPHWEGWGHKIMNKRILM